MSKKIYPAISAYPGAKAGYVGEAIAEILPYEGIDRFYDVFGGMANIILHKKPHPEEYYNDLNKKLATLMLVLSDEKLSQELFERMLDTVPYYSQSGFDYAQFVSNHMLDPNSPFMQQYPYKLIPGTADAIDTVEKAAAVWRTLLMSFNGAMQSFTGIREIEIKDGNEFEIDATKIKGNEALDLEYQLQKKTVITERMKNVNILNMNAFDLIELVKGDDRALMVCDSPYTLKQRNGKKIYECDFSDKDQKKYVNLLYDSRAKVLICGYHNDIYNSVLMKPNGPYKWYEYQVANVAKTMSKSSIGQMKSRATEVIWTNWKII